MSVPKVYPIPERAPGQEKSVPWCMDVYGADV